MIRLAHTKLNTVFEFRENMINSLVVETPVFLRELLTELICQSETDVGDYVLSNEYEPIKLSKNVELIYPVVPFDPNRKSLLTKLYSEMEQRGVDESKFTETQELLARIERYLLELSIDFPGEINVDKVSLIGLIKSAGIRFADEQDEPLSKLLNYMELTRELEGEKVFVLVNLRCYYSYDELCLFLNDVRSKKLVLFMMDSVGGDRFPFENRWTVDADLCEF